MSKTIKPSTSGGGDKGLKPSAPPSTPRPQTGPQKHSYQPSSPPVNPIKIPPKK